MKKIARTQSFRNLIDFNFIYIDKTEQINNLLQAERAFISRPRRFGKSLMLDTIRTLFEYGVEPYFRGTWIYDKWEEGTYPVLRLNFLDFGQTLEDFNRRLRNRITEFAGKLKLESYQEKDKANECLISLFSALDDSRQQIVILIDEYDCQIAANINEPETYEKFRSLLRDLYGIIKGKDCVHFFCITGVTRLKDMSIFSVGYDISDMSYNSAVSAITGFTREEIRKYYADYIDRVLYFWKGIPEEKVTEENRNELLDRLAEEYNGYCFDDMNKNKVFSTWSVNKFFSEAMLRKEVIFGDYWYENGGIPTILANYLKTHQFDICDYSDDISVNYYDFTNPVTLLDIDQRVLMCQTGYLTLNSVLQPYQVKLRIPNNEVKRALAAVFSSRIFSSYIKTSPDFRDIFCSGNADDIVSELNRMFNSLSYEQYPIKNEKSVQAYIHVFMLGGNMPVRTEIQSATGRADIILEYDKRRLILELKYAETEDDCEKKLREAAEQITSRKYGDTLPVKPAMKLALVFNGDRRVRQFTYYKEVC